MADLTIRVPSDLTELLAEQLLERYAAITAELHRAAERYARDRTGLDDLRGARVELFDLDDPLEQLHWGARPPAGPVEIVAHPEVLADAATGALDAVHDPAIRRALTALLATIMEGDGPGS
jgi:hypothetical protein